MFYVNKESWIQFTKVIGFKFRLEWRHAVWWGFWMNFCYFHATTVGNFSHFSISVMEPYPYSPSMRSTTAQVGIALGKGQLPSSLLYIWCELTITMNNIIIMSICKIPGALLYLSQWLLFTRFFWDTCACRLRESWRCTGISRAVVAHKCLVDAFSRPSSRFGWCHHESQEMGT